MSWPRNLRYLRRRTDRNQDPGWDTLWNFGYLTANAGHWFKPDVDTLDKLTVEIDGLVTHAIRQARWRASEPMATTADAASAFPITRDNAILRSLSAARCRCVEKNRETQFNWSIARHPCFGPARCLLDHDSD